MMNFHSRIICKRIKYEDILRDEGAFTECLKMRNIIKTCDFVFFMKKNKESFPKSSGIFLEKLRIFIRALNERTVNCFDIQCETMKKLKRLQRLHVAISLYNKSSNEYLNSLSKSLKNLISLRSLTLQIFEWVQIPLIRSGLILKSTNFTAKGLREIGKSLKRLPYFQSFGLILSNWEGKMTQELLSIFESLKNLKSLESLQIQFNLCPEITQDDLKDLSRCLKNLAFLKQIQLKIFNCPMILNDECLENVSAVFKDLPSLESIVLYMSRFSDFMGVTDQGMKSLGKGLNELKSLKKLELSFDKCNITNEGLNHLSEGLKKLNSLSFFHINFSK